MPTWGIRIIYRNGMEEGWCGYTSKRMVWSVAKSLVATHRPRHLIIYSNVPNGSNDPTHGQLVWRHDDC